MNIVDLALSKVGQKVTVPHNPYGGQCVSLVDYLLSEVTGGKYNLKFTNAIDVLKKAQSQGIPVEYDRPGAKPKAGAIFVVDTGDQFGHVGIVVKDSDGSSLETVEQNVDGYSDRNGNGINDQLEVGGGGITRRLSNVWYANGDMHRKGGGRVGKVVGWFYAPNQEKPTAPSTTSVSKFPATKNVNGDIYSGFITHADKNLMYADSNRKKIDKIVV